MATITLITPDSVDQPQAVAWQQGAAFSQGLTSNKSCDIGARGLRL